MKNLFMIKCTWTSDTSDDNAK